MPPAPEPLKPDAVSSIFERKAVVRPAPAVFCPAPAVSGPSAPLPRKTPAFRIKKKFPPGVDLGSSAVKIVQLCLDQNDTMRVLHAIIEELPTGALLDAKERARVTAEILRKTVAVNGLRGDCYAAAPRDAVKTNLVRLPAMPDGEIDHALRWEVRQTAQAPLEELSFDYLLLARQKPPFLANQRGALAVTAPKKEVFERMALLEGAGLKPVAIDTAELATAALIEHMAAGEREEVILVLDIGFAKTSLSIISNGELISTRYLTVTGSALTQAVSNNCKVPWPEAAALVKQAGIAAPPAAPGNGALTPAVALRVREVIMPLLENMARDIDHTFKHFSYQVTQSTITRFDRLLIAGGTSRLPGINAFLGDRLDVPVMPIDALGALGNACETVIGANLPAVPDGADLVAEASPRCAVAMGLALRCRK